MRRRSRITIAAIAGAAIAVGIGASPASAHPLGNFSVNQAHALVLTPDGVVDHAVVDFAEIPTAQADAAIDSDRDGTVSDSELRTYGADRCRALLADVELSVDETVVPFRLVDSSFARQPGTAGLPTTRLECELRADVDLTRSGTVRFEQVFESNRVGWREITATGDGLRLVESPVPGRSASNGLRAYPEDLLSSPLDQRDVSLRFEPGSSTGIDDETAAVAQTGGGGRSLSEGGPLAGLVERVTGVFDDLIGRRDLTLGVGLLAIGLAVLLGASHAVLPGHGKTVMAAYIAGRNGTARDAVMVGATVTMTHTGGVLLLGLALTVSSALAGETVLATLGMISGLLIALLGASLLVGTARHGASALHHGNSRHGHHHHGHDHIHGHDHDHGHDHEHDRGLDHDHGHDHDHAHDHDHGHEHHGQAQDHVHFGGRKNGHADPHDHGHLALGAVLISDGAVALADRPVLKASPTETAHPHGVVSPRSRPRQASRRALVGMGIAGGLVPSPSALIVLLSAIGLGRTAFGVLLVVGYGLGMAATLTGAGLILVRVRDHYDKRLAGRAARGMGAAAARWQRIMPFATAGIVLLVGLGLAVRSLGQLA